MSAATSIGAVAERLLDDERVHRQIRVGVDNLRGASGRARRKGGRAVGDQRLFDQLATAVSAFRAAGIRLAGAPEPERVGGVGSVLVLGVGAALLVTGLRDRH